ncbi:hypothetical protein WR25_01324 [Diploscapter pachys]|uniref:Uncharacterized protein n=1 Tax=Diploscapter pachys TaxID=2018661 RepID=A0A2A2M2V8_9BILA|nr:hypothetical protein WR25_01324 [Diploscapter pachys]
MPAISAVIWPPLNGASRRSDSAWNLDRFSSSLSPGISLSSTAFARGSASRSTIGVSSEKCARDAGAAAAGLGASAGAGGDSVAVSGFASTGCASGFGVSSVAALGSAGAVTVSSAGMSSENFPARSAACVWVPINSNDSRIDMATPHLAPWRWTPDQVRGDGDGKVIAPHACANSFVPTIPTTVTAMKHACTRLTLSPNSSTPPMMTPTAPQPVHTA